MEVGADKDDNVDMKVMEDSEGDGVDVRIDDVDMKCRG